MQAKKIVLSVAIAALMITAALPMIHGSEETTDEVPYENAERRSFSVNPMGQTTMAAGMQGNALVTPESPNDDMLPAITEDLSGNLVVAFTNAAAAMESNVGWSYSQNGGESWTAQMVQMEGVQRYNDVAWVQGSNFDGGGDFDGLWGVYIDISQGMLGFYRMTDITNTDTYEIYSWQTEYTDVTYASIADNTWYNEANYDITGPTNQYVYNPGSGYDIPYAPTHWFVGGAMEAGGVGYFDAQSELVTAPAADPDMSCHHDSDPAQTMEDYVHLTWQYDNPDTGNSQIVWKKIVPEEEPDIEYTPYQEYLDESADYDAAHPNIGSSGSNAAVVYQTNENGNWDIKCAYTSDAGDTWETTLVTDGDGDEMYPAAYMSGSTVRCAYVSDGNLYYIESGDGGATWDEPTQINDEDGTVVEEENTCDIHSGGIVWTDNRNGNKDIYWSQFPGPQMSIEGISGGMGITATVSNVGLEAGSNIDWTISLSGAVFLNSEVTGTIDSLEPGASTDISTGFVLGIGPTTIEVSAGGASQSASGFVLGPLVLGL